MAHPEPRREPADLAEAAGAAGCQVLTRRTLRDGQESWPVLELACADNAGAVRFLNEAAALDTTRAEVRDLALRIRAAHPAPLAYLKAVHAFVHSAVRFVREARETFQHTLYTLRRRAGDCDDHARAVAALALAGGAKARVVGVANSQGRVSHVATQVHDGSRWWWAETTVAAHFGEDPRAAAKRLGLTKTRNDITGRR